METKMKMGAKVSEYVMAIDIGTTKIVTFIGRRTSEGRLILEASHSVKSQGVEHGEVTNPTDTVNSIKDCLKGLKEKAQAHEPPIDVDAITKAVVGIAGRHIKTFKYPMSEVRDSPKHSITEKEMAQHLKKVEKIPFEPGAKNLRVFERGYFIDGVPQSKAVGCVGTRLAVDYLAVTGNVEAVEQIVRCVGLCERQVSSLLLEPIASAHAVLSEEERRTGVALLDIGGGTSDMVIYHDGRVHDLTVIPCGGVLITKDIAHTCELSLRQAEKLKCLHGGCIADCASDTRKFTFNAGEKVLSEKTLCTIIQKRVEEILEAVKYVLDMSECKQVKRIVLTGGGANLKNLPQLVAYHTGLDVRVGVPRVQTPTETCELAPEYATAVGLLMNARATEMTGGAMVTMCKNFLDRLLSHMFEDNDASEYDKLPVENSSLAIA